MYLYNSSWKEALLLANIIEIEIAINKKNREAIGLSSCIGAPFSIIQLIINPSKTAEYR